MVVDPLGGEVERHLGEVVGDDRLGRDVDHGRHRDAAGVVGEPGEVGLLQPLVAEHRVDPAGIEVEGPGPHVVGGAAQTHRDGVLQAEQPPDDDRPVGPRAGARRDQPVAARLHRIAVAAVPGDPGGDVVRVAGEVGAVGHVRAVGREVVSGHVVSLGRTASASGRPIRARRVARRQSRRLRRATVRHRRTGGQ